MDRCGRVPLGRHGWVYMARSGKVRQARCAKARFGKAGPDRHGPVWTGRQGPVWPRSRGEVCHGAVPLGRLGSTGHVRVGLYRCVSAGHGVARYGTTGKDWLGEARFGDAGRVGSDRCGQVGQLGQGGAWRGAAGQGGAGWSA